MSNLQNVTFGDRDTTHLKYSGNWFLSGSYNASNVGQTGTLSSTSDLNARVTFAFPEPVVAFYYYGIPRCCGGTYGICIDCDPNNPNFITIDAVNRTDDGHNPPVVLFSKVFDTLGMHEIIIANQNDARFGKSQLTIASIVLEVPVDNSPGSGGGGGTPSGSTTSKTSSSVTAVPNSGASGSSSAGAASSVSASSASVSGKSASITTAGSGSQTGSSSPSSSSSSTSGTPLDANNNGSSSSSSSSHTPLGAIIGGVLAALAIFLIIIILAFWIRLRRRRRAAAAHEIDRSIPPSTAATSTFNYPSPTPFMSETATPATSSLSPSSRVNGWGVGKLGGGPSHRPQFGTGAGQSVSTFSDATGLSASSSAAQSGGTNNSTLNSNANSGTTSTRIQRREVDGGPVYSPVLPEEEEDTLPPDYMEVFAARRSVMARAQRGTVPGTPSQTGAGMGTNRAMSESDGTESSSVRGGGGGQMDLSPLRRKN